MGAIAFFIGWGSGGGTHGKYSSATGAGSGVGSGAEEGSGATSAFTNRSRSAVLRLTNPYIALPPAFTHLPNSSAAPR